jgi:hypothetical protein
MLVPQLLSALADPLRLQVFGRICSDPDGVPAASLQPYAKAAARLEQAGLIEQRDGRYHASAQPFTAALKEFGETRRSPGPGPAPVAALFREGRLVHVPRPGALRRQLLEVLAERFAAGRDYSEKEVGAILSPVVDDVAAFRRYLVDHGLLDRDNHGRYWRADDPVGVSRPPR